MYDGRIGRWLSVDPVGQYDSPYVGMGNNPIGIIDPSGGEGVGCCGVNPGTFDLLGALISFFNPQRGSLANPIALHEVSVVGYVTKKKNTTSLSSWFWQRGTDLDNSIPQGGETYQPFAYVETNNDGRGNGSFGGHGTAGHYDHLDVTGIGQLAGGWGLDKTALLFKANPLTVVDLIYNTGDGIMSTDLPMPIHT